MRATRIEHHEIEQFITQCTGDATRWTTGGTDFDRWCNSNNENGKCAETEWLTEVVIPYLKHQFDRLEVREDGCLYGVRNGTNEVLPPNSYDVDSVSTCMVAECLGQRWKFALGCCRKRTMQRNIHLR
jgi:hypothetical protein